MVSAIEPETLELFNAYKQELEDMFGVSLKEIELCPDSDLLSNNEKNAERIVADLGEVDDEIERKVHKWGAKTGLFLSYVFNKVKSLFSGCSILYRPDLRKLFLFKKPRDERVFARSIVHDLTHPLFYELTDGVDFGSKKIEETLAEGFGEYISIERFNDRYQNAHTIPDMENYLNKQGRKYNRRVSRALSRKMKKSKYGVGFRFFKEVCSNGSGEEIISPVEILRNPPKDYEQLLYPRLYEVPSAAYTSKDSGKRGEECEEGKGYKEAKEAKRGEEGKEGKEGKEDKEAMEKKEVRNPEIPSISFEHTCF